MKEIKGDVLFGFLHGILHKVPYTARLDGESIQQLDFDLSPELNKEAWGPLEQLIHQDIERQLRWEQKSLSDKQV